MNEFNLTTTYLEQKFNEFNSVYFKGELNKPTLVIFKSKRLNGQYSWKYNLKGELIKSVIRISNYYKRSEFDFCNTLIHEMIHLYIRQNNIKDTRPHHGRVFYSIANRINKEGGWDIQRCNSNKGNESNVKQDFVVASFEQRGRRFVFVINKKKVGYYINRFERYAHYYINPIIFKTSNTKEFSNYCVCRSSVRGFYKNLDEFNRLLEEKTELIYNGETLSVCHIAG